MMTNLVLGKSEINALAFCIDNTPDISGTQRVQVECGPQPEETGLLYHKWQCS